MTRSWSQYCHGLDLCFYEQTAITVNDDDDDEDDGNGDDDGDDDDVYEINHI